jgi:hypothetical protein
MAQIFTVMFYKHRVLRKFNLKDEINERFSNAMKNNMIYTSRNIVCAVTSRSLTWARRVTEVGKTKIQSKMLTGKRLWKHLHGRREREVCDNFKK